MSYNAKNYTEQGGDKTVIGGTLEILEGAQVKGLPSRYACRKPGGQHGVRCGGAGGGLQFPACETESGRTDGCGFRVKEGGV